MTAANLRRYATPVANMPDWLQTVTLINPIRDFVVISKGVFLKDLPADVIMAHLWPLPNASRQMVNEMAVFLGVRMWQSAEKNGLGCASCHSDREPHRALFGGDYAGCHETTKWRIVGCLHPSPTSRDCAQCHQAPPSHYMMHFKGGDDSAVQSNEGLAPGSGVAKPRLGPWQNPAANGGFFKVD